MLGLHFRRTTHRRPGGPRVQPELDGDVDGGGQLAVRLLGGFAARRGADPVAGSVWRLRKGRELVKLLALAPRHQLHREQLMDTLWPELDSAAAANNLNQVVHVARRALGSEAIVLGGELLRLAAEVDVDAFELAAQHARRAGTAGAYRAALALYGGELLPENRYDDWASGRREELELLREDLERELAACGDGRLSSLPLQASSFIGRGHELRELLSLSSRTRLVTLAGAGGSGKTRLALELAREAEPSFSQGAALVELANVSEARLLAPAVADALDVGALPGRSIEDAVLDFLEPRNVLIVLDNCEHLLDAAARLTDSLLRAAPGVSVIATSREPLRVAGEVVFRVPSLAIPDPDQPLDAEQLLRYESVQLLAERAAAASPGFAIDDRNAADVARICFRLDGLPLALELAAARIGALGTAALAARLDDSFQVLRAGNRAGPTRQQTLAAMLEWSHDLLGDDEKRLLRRLAVFAGGFELSAVEQVCAEPAPVGGEVADVLARLVEKSLITAEPAGGALRYHPLETVRLYADERLDEAGEREAFEARHAAWAMAEAETRGGSPGLDREAANLRRAHPALLRTDPERALSYCVALLPFWMRRIDLQEGHRRLQDALAAAPRRTRTRAAALLAASAIDLRSGDLARGVVHARESLEIAEELDDPRARWLALQRLGELAISRDDSGEAILLLSSARALAERAGFPAWEAVSIYSLGVARWPLGDLEGADAALVQATAAFRALAGSPERAPALLNIAELRSSEHSGQPGTRLVFEETLQPFREISCDTAISYVLANQATIARVSGDLGRARSLLVEAGARFAATADERGAADVLIRSAYLALAAGDRDEARERLEQALRIRRGLRDRRGVGMALLAVGVVETAGANHEQAEQPLAEARAMFRRAGDRWGLVSALWRSADLALARGRLDEAETLLVEARGVVEQTERQKWIGVTIATLGEVAALRGDLRLAGELFEQAASHYAAGGFEDEVRTARERMRTLAKGPQSERKSPPRRTVRKTTSKRRQS
jgi:predicted ATPase